jgi:hypothetical protein
MEVLLGAIIGALASLVGSLFISSRSTKVAVDAQREMRRTRRHEYLLSLMDRLLDARGEYEAFLGKPAYYHQDDHGQHELAIIVGKAIAVCLAVDDSDMTRIAKGVQGDKDFPGLTPYRVPAGGDDSNMDYKERNRVMMDKAVERLGVLIREQSE